MSYKIIRRKSQASDVEIAMVIRKHCKYSAIDAMTLVKAMNDSFEFGSYDLYMAVSAYYEIEEIKDPDPWERPQVYLYSEEDRDAALSWFENLSDKEKEWIEILRYENPTFIVPSATS